MDDFYWTIACGGRDDWDDVLWMRWKMYKVYMFLLAVMTVFCAANYVKEVIDDWNSAPTVDAVEVMRCKDCFHFWDGICKTHNDVIYVDDTGFCIESAPTIDPVNHAHWESEYGTHYCSKCKNYIAHEPTFYCPNCGAKMDEIVDGYKYDFKTQTYVYIQSP